MTDSSPRLRFAPSPTGYLHVGGARTALYNYLLAKKTGGTFVLRIEDTDLERSTPESIQAILDGMTWLGLTWDEGPYYQTKRFDLYLEYIQKLLDEKKAYPCFCSAESLDAKRKLAMAEKRKPMYDRTCLKLDAAEVEKRVQSGEPHCIRFQSPDDGEIVMQDVIKGTVTVLNKELDDLVIRRADGSPTYNFTVVIDDVTMNITHVIRGDDHLNNTPRQIQLYQALGLPIPLFAHVPMILGADKKRLSKRHGATSVMAYKDMGFLPEALLNYLVRLGWSHKDQEVFSMQEMTDLFNLEACSSSAGVFNPEKLLWLNGLHIRQTSPEYLAELMPFYLKAQGIETWDESILLEGIKISQEKVKTMVEMVEMVDFFFKDVTIPEELTTKFLTAAYKPILAQVMESLGSLAKWDLPGIQSVFEKLVSETGLGLGKIAQPLRVLLTGRTISPGVFEIIRILGRDKTLARLKQNSSLE